MARQHAVAAHAPALDALAWLAAGLIATAGAYVLAPGPHYVAMASAFAVSLGRFGYGVRRKR